MTFEELKAIRSEVIRMIKGLEPGESERFILLGALTFIDEILDDRLSDIKKIEKTWNL